MPFPETKACLVCEGARLEAYGKYSVLGFYGIAPDVYIAIREFIQPITLCFFFVCGRGSGNFNVGARLIAPNGSIIEPPSVQASLDASIPLAFFIFTVQNALPGPGQYRVLLRANQEERYATTIECSHVTPEQMAHLRGP
ncbi:MAG: hypothetical protein DMG32_07790 [Acidobacteria bacterium]|nr:MAG: hypothetical protein DMG32_07790 [Acidobacteriota bacterium]